MNDLIFRRIRPRILVSTLVLCVIYLMSYHADPATPGNAGRFPAGWWGWWDQSHYLLSARALARGDLLPARHWYPLGYPVLGAPFTLLFGWHAFLLPDLACLLLCFAGFVTFSGCVGVSFFWASASFILASCGHETLRKVWAEPWNTSLSSALVWWLLALTASQLTRPLPPGHARVRRFMILGSVAALIPFTRPTDGLLVGIWAVGAGVLASRFRGTAGASDLLAFAAGCTALMLPEAALWLGIYGPRPSGYMMQSRALGFSLDNAGWKTYLLLSAPRPWFPYGKGIVQTLPWVVPGLAGILALPFITRGPKRAILLLMATMIVTYSLMFFCYTDLIPSGLWRFQNIHYFKWTLPGLALLALELLRALLTGPRAAPALCLLSVLLLIDLRMTPVLRESPGRAWMIQLPGPVPGFDEAYNGRINLRDALGPLQRVRDFRALPDSEGWRLIALRRPFAGRVVVEGVGHWPDGPVPPDAPRWDRGWSLRLPCWMAACTRAAT